MHKNSIDDLFNDPSDMGTKIIDECFAKVSSKLGIKMGGKYLVKKNIFRRKINDLKFSYDERRVLGLDAIENAELTVRLLSLYDIVIEKQKKNKLMYYSIYT